MAKHADKRPPSSAGRWLSCPGSVDVMPLYPNEPNEKSIKGDEAHDLLNTGITFGVIPDHHDIDLTYSALFAYEKIMETYQRYKPCEMYSEVHLDIPETGEFGTADIVFVNDKLIHIIDYKNGYVPVNVRMNAQLLCYLLGAIARWGERKTYRISVIQPNYPHADGMYRDYEVTQDDLAWFRKEVQWAMVNTHLAAGTHCKTSYCPHRGSCAVFAAWAPENLKLAWFPGELSALDDEQLAQAMEQAEILQGWQNALRGEALRRMMHQDRTIPGYKVVRGKKDRAFRDDAAREEVFNRLRVLGVPDEQLHEPQPISVAGVERRVKAIFKSQGRSAWVPAMHSICGPDMLAPTNQSLTVEKTIDGRKPYTKGQEFGPITPQEGTNGIALKQPSELANKPVEFSII